MFVQENIGVRRTLYLFCKLWVLHLYSGRQKIGKHFHTLVTYFLHQRLVSIHPVLTTFGTFVAFRLRDLRHSYICQYGHVSTRVSMDRSRETQLDTSEPQPSSSLLQNKSLYLPSVPVFLSNLLPVDPLFVFQLRSLYLDSPLRLCLFIRS